MSSLVRCSFLIALVSTPLIAAAQDPVPPQPVQPPPVEPPPPVAPKPPPLEALPKPEEPKDEDKDREKKDTPWYEKFAIRGYLQTRFNRLYTTNDDLKNDLGDKNIAKNNSFSIRRARLVVSGDVAPFLAVYLQAEFAGADAKMRDWYGDIYTSKDKEARIRIGQQKIPFGWENMQSSQNRAPLDRSDPINSGVPGERDLGIVGYWAPAKVRKAFKHLVDSGLKGSGDYGVLALGVYNGQGINVDDKNENRHVVARVTYPFELGTQILEVGAAGYIGKFTPERDEDIGGVQNVTDQRAGAHLVLYPKPIGFQAEYNIGRGPELTGDTIDVENLHGGYAMVIAKAKYGFFPFVRAAYYDGGIKSVKNAPHHESTELIVGTEWHYHKRIEVTVELNSAKRTVGDATEKGTIIRAQVQLNY